MPGPTFLGLPRIARAYVAAVTGAGVACLITAALQLRLDSVMLFVTLLAAGVLTSAAKIELPLGRSQSNLSLSHAVNFWALFALPPAEAISIAAVSAWSQCTMRAAGRNPLHRIVFSIASLVVTVAVAALMLPWFRGGADGPAMALVRAGAFVAPVYFFFNTLLVAGAIALSTRQRIAAIWHHNFLWSAPSYFAGAALAMLAHVAWARGWFGWLTLLVLPLYLVFRSYAAVVARLRKEQEDTRRAMEVQLATIEALALAIEAKAGCTPEHIRSIQYFAAILAEAVGMSDVDVQAVRTAALLHDVGNMAVPEHILSKPSALTADEFERVKIHPRVGAEILRNVPFASAVNDLVLSHHERWDGLGYPTGLSGESIPLGARILAIADCFSTLQSDRPYRPKRSEADAIVIIREHSGTAFDPSLVELLTSRVRAAAPVLDLQDIAGAHREAQTLYEIAQALGSSLGVAEAMALIQEKMNRLVPFVTCALFLGNDEDGYSCRYAHGPGTEALFKSTPALWSELSRQIPVCADGRAGHGEDLGSVLACPLRFNGRLVGGLVIYHLVDGGFTDEHRRVLERVSDQAAAVIYNSTRFEQTQHESHTDPLTGLANRRSLDRQVEAGLAHAARAKTGFSVVVLDLDRLKEINDTYGHEAGDRAIRTVGDVLQATVRQTDICARFAGDEFVVILWDYSPEHEERRVLDIQNAVSAHGFEPRAGVQTALSISAGSARFPEDGKTFDELLAAADERMYRDKAGRRSRNTGRRSLSQLEHV
jgi:diguanylate cyclase (GGDEF)-like protein/putative nucleotidyltransferase with HDIG domain